MIPLRQLEMLFFSTTCKGQLSKFIPYLQNKVSFVQLQYRTIKEHFPQLIFSISSDTSQVLQSMNKQTELIKLQRHFFCKGHSKKQNVIVIYFFYTQDMFGKFCIIFICLCSSLNDKQQIIVEYLFFFHGKHPCLYLDCKSHRKEENKKKILIAHGNNFIHAIKQDNIIVLTCMVYFLPFFLNYRNYRVTKRSL